MDRFQQSQTIATLLVLFAVTGCDAWTSKQAETKSTQVEAKVVAPDKQADAKVVDKASVDEHADTNPKSEAEAQESGHKWIPAPADPMTLASVAVWEQTVQLGERTYPAATAAGGDGIYVYTQVRKGGAQDFVVHIDASGATTQTVDLSAAKTKVGGEDDWGVPEAWSLAVRPHPGGFVIAGDIEVAPENVDEDEDAVHERGRQGWLLATDTTGKLDSFKRPDKEEHIAAVAVTRSGQIWALGSYENDATLWTGEGTAAAKLSGISMRLGGFLFPMSDNGVIVVANDRPIVEESPYIARVDTDGKIVWSKTLGDKSEQTVKDAKFVAEGIAVLASDHERYWLNVLSLEGVVSKSKMFGAAESHTPTGVVQLATGHYLVCGVDYKDKLTSVVYVLDNNLEVLGHRPAGEHYSCRESVPLKDGSLLMATAQPGLKGATVVHRYSHHK